MKRINNLKLHEAIYKVVSNYRDITPKQVCRIINSTKLYQKRNLTKVEVSQIYARINKYPNLFYLEKVEGNSSSYIRIKITGSTK